MDGTGSFVQKSDTPNFDQIFAPDAYTYHALASRRTGQIHDGQERRHQRRKGRLYAENLLHISRHPGGHAVLDHAVQYRRAQGAHHAGDEHHPPEGQPARSNGLIQLSSLLLELGVALIEFSRRPKHTSHTTLMPLIS